MVGGGGGVRHVDDALQLAARDDCPCGDFDPSHLAVEHRLGVRQWIELRGGRIVAVDRPGSTFEVDPVGHGLPGSS